MVSIKERYRRLTMQKKLTISFAVPLTLICILITMCCAPVMSNAYRKQIQYSVGQSGEQVRHYITHYIENMYYMGQLIVQSSEVNRVLSDPSLGQYKDMAEAYREFYKLNSIFIDMESTNLSYRIGMYIPDELIYSNNCYFFYPESQLKELDEYEEMMEAVQKGQLYYTIMQEHTRSDMIHTKPYITQVTAMEVNGHTYIVKVGIGVEDVVNMLNTAQITPDNLIYLLDDMGDMLAASDHDQYAELEDELPSQKQEQWSTMKLGGTRYYIMYYQLERYNWQIFSLIPVETYKRQASFVSFMVMLVAVLMILAIIVVSYFLSKYYVRRLARVNLHMKSLENGDLNNQINSNRYVQGTGDEIDEIYANFNNMAMRLQGLMKAHYKLGKSVMSAELRALQAQINPHFLYNTLDLINWGAMEHGADEVAQMARDLGMFYRLSLNHGKAAIHIEEELKHVEAYVSIESVHFPGAIHMNMEVPQQIREYACLNIILQPFVENAIVHGIAQHPDIIECNILITAVQEENDIIFTIEDDGPGMDQEQMDSILKESDAGKENGYGVKNTNFRMKLCYGDKYGVRYESGEMGGTKVILRIPVMTYEQLEEILK